MKCYWNLMWKGLLFIQYISCYNLDMLIDICHICQIYLNCNYFYFWSKVYVLFFQFWRRFWDWNFLIVLWWILSFTIVCKFGPFCFSFYLLLLSFLVFVGMNLCKHDVSYLLLCSICFIVFFCLSFSVLFIVYVTSQLNI